MAASIILQLEHGLRMSDEQRIIQLRKQVGDLQRTLNAMREENALLTHERDELILALKGWAKPEDDIPGDPFEDFLTGSDSGQVPLRTRSRHRNSARKDERGRAMRA